MWQCAALLSILVLLVQLVRPLKISEDTLRAINQDAFYPAGFAILKYSNDPSNILNVILSRPTGAIKLARSEYVMHSAILKKTSAVTNYSEAKDFTRDVLEYVQDYKATARSLMQSGASMETCVKSVAENMIAVYRMVRRFRNYIQPWKLERKKTNHWPFQREIIDALNSSGKVLDLCTSDFHLSIIPIITTQFVLDWKAEDICQGTIKGMELGSTLMAVHCLELGVHAIASGMYPIGIEWIEQAVSKATQHNDTSVHVQFALDLLHKAYAKHDERWRPRNVAFFEETFYKTRLNTSMSRQDKIWAREWQKEIENMESMEVPLEAHQIERFSNTCQGKIKQSELMKSKLFCWLETYVHPTWRIGPLKVELVSGFPHDVVLFHDVVSKSLTKEALEHCEPLLRPAELHALGFNPKTRLSSFCLLFSGPTIESRLDGLTERLTGLRTKHTSPSVVSSFPVGGHTNLHLDHSEVGQEDFGATVIYYLQAAEIGGGIGFTGAEVHLEPPVGSAIFWFHMLKSGDMRKGGAHGGCPVVQGQKWVDVKFLEYLKQTHLFCDSDQNAKMEYLVNGQTKYK